MTKASTIRTDRITNLRFWETVPGVVGLGAAQLKSDRLAIVLGAGASSGFSLPEWGELVTRAFKAVRRTPPDLPPLQLGERLLTDACGGNEEKFSRLIADALYRGHTRDFANLRRYGLLTGVAALAMGRRRGMVKHIINFNVDDMVEWYLRQYGLDVDSVVDAPAWPSQCDVRVYHPHGFAPFEGGDASRTPMFAKLQFDRENAKSEHPWERTLIDIMSARTCLFIGLSGADPVLMALLETVRQRHLGIERGDRFWGIRFSKSTRDPLRAEWAIRGVAQCTVRKWNDVPDILFQICQRAAGA